MARSFLPALGALPLITLLACGGDSTDDLFVGPSSGAAGTSAGGGGTSSGGQASVGGQGGEVSGSSGQTAAGAAGKPGAGAGGSPSGGQAGQGAAGQGGSPAAGQGGAASGGASGKGGSPVAGQGGTGGAAGKGGTAQGGSSTGGMSQGGAGQGGSTAGSNTGGSSAGAPGSVCGDGQRVAPEVCDGADFDGRTCATETGFAESQGALGCVDCKVIDASGCTKAPVCGDGVRNGNEACEGMDLGTQTCATATSNQKTEGTLKCTPQCALDTSGCTTAKPACGNGVFEQGEQCDGKSNSQSCASFAPGSTGTLGCKSDCTFDTSTCKPAPKCGDGVLDGNEECDDKNDKAGDGCELCRVVCLPGEWEYQKHCYREYTEKKNWLEAQKVCKDGGGYLVSITSQEESAFLQSVLPPPVENGESRWIGLDDYPNENVFAWDSQEPYGAFKNWNEGEPNDFQNTGPEDCVTLYLGNVKWNDVNCFADFSWICEFPPPVGGP